jgi:hypothetical protein
LLGYRKAPERDKDAQQERSDDEDEMESFERHFVKQFGSFRKNEEINKQCDRLRPKE